jgi:hypothetical protein
MKNSQKGFIVPLLIVIIALLAIGGGVYISKNKKAEAPVLDIEAQQTNTQTDTSDWKTFSTKDFSVNYPIDWMIIDTDGKNLFIAIINPKQQGKSDTDEPTEGVWIKQDSFCKDESWHKGFGLFSYRTACASLGSQVIRIDGVAGGEGIQKIDIIIRSFMSHQISVLYPNGGEVFKPGQHVKITWKDITNHQTIKLMVVAGKVADGHYTNNGSMGTSRGYQIYSGPNIGSFDWIVPTEYPGEGNYLIRISSAAGQGSDSLDYSDNYFMIVAQSNTSNWKTYTNAQYNFSIQYPKNFTMAESQGGGFFDEQNLYDLSINAPADYQKDTDFNIGRIEMFVSPKTTNCFTLSQNGGNLSAVKIINGISFHYNPQQPFEDDAMGGQRGKDSLFAAILNGQCYRIEKLVGYRDAHGFTEPPYPPHFDEQKVNADLDAIISTFKFTK